MRQKLRRAAFTFTVFGMVFGLTAPVDTVPASPSSSIVGMGSATGTPSGDIRAAIEPRLRSVRTPESVRSVEIPETDLMPPPELPASLELSPRDPIRIGIDATLGDSVYAEWLAYTTAQIRHALGPRNVEVLWLEDRTLALAVRTRQVDFFIMDSDRNEYWI